MSFPVGIARENPHRKLLSTLSHQLCLGNCQFPRERAAMMFPQGCNLDTIPGQCHGESSQKNVFEHGSFKMYIQHSEPSRRPY